MADADPKLWAFSSLVCRALDVVGCEYRHAAGVVRARNQNEAIGSALRIARRCYPAQGGWHGHDIVVHDCDDVLDPETVNTVTPTH